MVYFIGLFIAFFIGAIILAAQLKNQRDEFKAQLLTYTTVLADIRVAVTQYMLNNNDIFDAIAKQKKILNRDNRPAIAIFLNYDLFKDILKDLNVASIDNLADALTELSMPIAYIGNLPVYISKSLITAPIFVVGSITWDFDA